MACRTRTGDDAAKDDGIDEQDLSIGPADRRLAIAAEKECCHRRHS
jgi:hypothetical protein